MARLLSSCAVAVAALVVLSSHVVTSSATRASFGQPCDTTEVRCDSRKSLTCEDGTCGCFKPSEMIYDGKKQKCVVLSGERCSYTAIEILSDSSQQQEKRWTERLDCVENGQCNEQGFCECEKDFFETSERQCAPRRSHGETCTKHQECLMSKQLHCVGATCSCNETESIFDTGYSGYEKCVAKVGVSYQKYGGWCVRNAGSRYGDTCRCARGYTTSNDGLCIGPLGSSCFPHMSPCDVSSECIDLTCSCPFPEFQKALNGKCASSVLGPCTHVSSLTGELVRYSCEDPNAECRKNQHGIATCQCKPGWIESRDRRNNAGRQCRRDIGFPCLRNEDCDSVAGLTCLNGKCSCGNLHVYDRKATKCRGLVGAMCNPLEEAFCIDGAFCVRFRSSPSSGSCQCVPPATPNSSTRTCGGIKVLQDVVGIQLIDTINSAEHIS